MIFIIGYLKTHTDKNQIKKLKIKKINITNFIIFILYLYTINLNSQYPPFHQL